MDVPSKMIPWIGCALVSFAATACGGSEDGVPIDSTLTTITLTATSTDESAVAVGSEDAALGVDEVGLSLRSLELAPCAADAAPLTVEHFPVELSAEPAAQANFESGVSDYCALRLAVEPSPGDDPPELGGLSVLVRGTRSDGVPFEIRSLLELDVELSSAEAFGSAYLALGFDLAAWFSGVDVDGASVSDGVALVDDGTNASVLAAFEANTSAAVALYIDADRDGVLDADELDGRVATEERR